MIIILEGTNGVGKSEYAKRLSKYFVSIPILRAFRGGDSDFHMGHTNTEKFQWLREVLKIPVNTHVDDMYVADLLSNFSVDAILDRSMPSAIAYGVVDNQDMGWYAAKGVARTLLAYWQDLLCKAHGPVTYIWLKASYEVAKDRCQDRWAPNKTQYEKLEKCFGKIFQDITLTKRQINTDHVEINDGVKSICSMIQDLLGENLR